MSRAHELNWCAGFFDGEGFITIQRRVVRHKDKTYTGHYLRIGINHVSPKPLKEFHKILGGTFVYDKSSEKPNQDGFKRTPRYKWHASCEAASLILIQLLPYFRNKNEVASLAIEFQKTMQQNKQKVSEEVINLREQFKQNITLLNAKD